MQRILVLGYSSDDKGLLVHLFELCKALKGFSIGFEFKEPEFDLTEQITLYQKKIRSIEDLAQRWFGLTFEQLFENADDILSEDIDEKDRKAFKALARQAKVILFQGAIMEALRDNEMVDFYGINKQSLELIKEHLNNIDDTDIAMLTEKNHLSMIREELKTTRAAIETLFLTSAGYELPDTLKQLLRQMQIPVSPISTQKDNERSIPSIIQKALVNLRHKVRLSASVTATRGGMSSSIVAGELGEKSQTSDPDFSRKIRSVTGDAFSHMGSERPTITGTEHSSQDDDDE